MINVHRRQSSVDQVDQIEYKEGAGELDFVNLILEPTWDSSWLNVNPRVLSKDISQPPSKKRSVKEPKWNSELSHKDKPARDTCRTVRWVKRVKKTGIWTLHTFVMCLPS